MRYIAFIFVLIPIVFIGPILAQIKLLPRGDESKYTKSEQQALVKLRKMVKKDLYEDYMHRDEYLIAWLRTRQLDVNKAAELIRANVKWRNDEKIDDFHNEKFPQLDGAYNADIQTHTKDGRAVVLFPYSSWDVRKAALSGQIKNLIRYLTKNIFELPQRKAREEGQADGSNSTQFLVLADLGGYNLRQHACIRCMEMYLGYIRNYESHYPQGAVATLAINTPKIFDPAVQLARPFMSEHFISNLHLLGPDKDDWKPKLDKIIAPSELPKRYGGTHSRKV